MPDEALLTEMGRFNEELVKAGVMLGGEGLHPSSRGARVRFSGTAREVTDGPFAEGKEFVGGFDVVQAHRIGGPAADHLAAAHAGLELDFRLAGKLVFKCLGTLLQCGHGRSPTSS